MKVIVVSNRLLELNVGDSDSNQILRTQSISGDRFFPISVSRFSPISGNRFSSIPGGRFSPVYGGRFSSPKRNFSGTKNDCWKYVTVGRLIERSQ